MHIKLGVPLAAQLSIFLNRKISSAAVTWEAVQGKLEMEMDKETGERNGLHPLGFKPSFLIKRCATSAAQKKNFVRLFGFLAFVNREKVMVPSF